jgi:hypothetical protein
LKKKFTKKLALHRETLVNLEKDELEQAAGGYTARCQYSDGQRTCTTCDNNTCTTNFC